MLIATDLDGTFLAGTPAQRSRLYQWIDAHDDVQLAYVTGRGLPLVTPLLDDPDLPRPDYLICDVGATLADGQGRPIASLMADIEAAWPGEQVVVAALAHLPGLQRQPQPQARRCSFHCTPEQVGPEVRDAIDALGLGLDLLYSADWYLDVLPGGVNKGSSLRRLVRHLGLSDEAVLVAGDTLNDLSMYEHGFRGVCVGGSEPALLDATRELPLVLHASGPGCDGILQALDHFQLQRPLP